MDLRFPSSKIFLLPATPRPRPDLSPTSPPPRPTHFRQPQRHTPCPVPSPEGRLPDDTSLRPPRRDPRLHSAGVRAQARSLGQEGPYPSTPTGRYTSPSPDPRVSPLRRPGRPSVRLDVCPSLRPSPLRPETASTEGRTFWGASPHPTPPRAGAGGQARDSSPPLPTRDLLSQQDYYSL